MAFLDNSGDIILDAVLTDTGRMRMAKGNFNIAKFAFGDEEMNYQLFNNAHPSGSAFYDLELMQTPILEPSTNNVSSMHSKLVTMGRTNMLYMPVLRLNYQIGQSVGSSAERTNANSRTISNTYRSFTRPWVWGAGWNVIGTRAWREDATIGTGTAHGTYTDAQIDAHNNFFVVAGDLDTELRMVYGDQYEAQKTAQGLDGMASSILAESSAFIGWMPGSDNTYSHSPSNICVDQGIISSGDPNRWQSLPEDLKETQWIVQIDHRLGRITSPRTQYQFNARDNNNSYWGTGQGQGNAHGNGRCQVQPYSFVDDDNIATYFFGFGSDQQMVSDAAHGRPPTDANDQTKNAWATALVDSMLGPLGTRFRFSIKASQSLQNSDALWNSLGSADSNFLTYYGPKEGTNLYSSKESKEDGHSGTSAHHGKNDVKLKFIDTTVRVTGVTTGYHIDIPVKFVRYLGMVKS